MESKYIVVDRVKPVIFNAAIQHVDEAAGRNITSAGFCKVSIEGKEIKITCWGESDSLGGIKSRPGIDSKLIKAMLVN